MRWTVANDVPVFMPFILLIISFALNQYSSKRCASRQINCFYWHTRRSTIIEWIRQTSKWVDGGRRYALDQNPLYECYIKFDIDIPLTGCRFKGRIFPNGDEWHPTVQPFGEVKCVRCRCKVCKFYG
jgi:hypothetical protein